MKKRYPKPRITPQTLRLKIAREGGVFDLHSTWGDGCSKGDSNYIMSAFAYKQHSGDALFIHPSILKELEMRGYDLTTLRFSIKKLPDGEEPKFLWRNPP